MTKVATYTSLTDIDAPAICALYGLARVQLEPLDGGAANSSFKATAAQGEFVLTILDNHTTASAYMLAAHTEAMHRLGIPTAEVVRNLDADPVSVFGERLILLKRWINGQVLEALPFELLSIAGGLLARLHEIPVGAVPDLPVRTRRLSLAHVAAIEEFPDRDFGDWLARRLRAVREVEIAQPFRSDVVCHGDMFTDNLIVRPDGQLSIIDWETVSFDSSLLDLGMTLLGLARTNGKLDYERAEQIVAGYLSVRPLPEEDLEVLPTAVEHAALIIAFHRYYRHNIRFPDADKSKLHLELIGFVESLVGMRGRGADTPAGPHGLAGAAGG